MEHEDLDRFTSRYISLYSYLRLEEFRASTASAQAMDMALAEQSVAEGNSSPEQYHLTLLPKM